MRDSTAKKSPETGELSRNQEKAIVALLAHPSISDAAKSAGVSESSIWRWLQDETFRKHYRKAQDKVFDGALGSLQGATTQAVDCLVRNLTCKMPSAEVTAAKTILDFTMKARELLDLSARVEELERAIAAAG
jgi:transposase